MLGYTNCEYWSLTLPIVSSAFKKILTMKYTMQKHKTVRIIQSHLYKPDAEISVNSKACMKCSPLFASPWYTWLFIGYALEDVQVDGLVFLEDHCRDVEVALEALNFVTELLG